jgi:glycyl-tRNA synthetase beta chain
MGTSEFLLEVGTEEIPARMMEDALSELETAFSTWVTENDLDDGETVGVKGAYGTPRRLILHAELPEKQPDRIDTEKGPPEHVAYDDGEPTQALEGFCAQHDVSTDEVEVRDIDGGSYTVLELEREGRSTEELLKRDLEEMVLGLPWPKSMRWESSNTEFVRPIRWAVCFFGDEPLEVEVGPVTTGTETRGLRLTDHERIGVDDPADFFESLEEAGIVFDQEERRSIIVDGARRLAEKQDGEAHLPDDLVEEVNHLVESPTPFLGEYDEEFLDLPPEVLEEAMIAHQKYFPVRSPDGDQLLPYFVGVRNGDEQHLDTVRRGNEKVIRARLSDAVFFYEKDLERDYKSYREGLKGVVFQEKLGSLHDKTERMARLAADLEGVPEGLETIARHCKNDHVTEIVGEFPKLQGTMGRIYATESGWSESDARVIEEHYQPKGRESSIPDSTMGQWLSFIDRLDTLVGFFGIGERVSGSSDPYGLRRDALGLLRILVNGDINPDLSSHIRSVVDHYGSLETGDEFVTDLEDFLRDRLYYLLRDLTEAADDEIKAVLDPCWNRPHVAHERVRWLSDWRTTDRFEDLYTTAQRIENITADVDLREPDPDHFEKPEEEALWDEYRNRKDDVEEAVEEGRADDVLELLAQLREVTDDFFEEVMVMADDEQLKENRLALLRSVRTVFDRVAHFSLIQLER